ncbi:MAG: hydrolase, alpha/beta fold family, partial [Massilia sp.]|nr:hydrolase, alpha/beta fold family [Massilia sp.]
MKPETLRSSIATRALATFAMFAMFAMFATAAEAGPAIADQPIVLDTPTGQIVGSLVLPLAKAPVPVALIIAGSGPTDRNGNSAG